MKNKIVLSIVIPFYNEEKSIERVVDEVMFALEIGFDQNFEILLVDDGSTDNTGKLCNYYASSHSVIRSLHLQKNGGQSAALAAGFRAAKGQYIATLDGDGQNDPADIPRLLKLLISKNVDMVAGIRQKRHDNFVRRSSSKIANLIRSALLHDGISDTGCSLKVFKRSAMLNICLFRNSHRYYPALFMIHGYKVAQAPVAHRSRKAGVSKYGGGINSRLWVGIVDICGVMWLKRRTLKNTISEFQVR